MSSYIQSGYDPNAEQPTESEADDGISPLLLALVLIAVMMFWDLMFAFSNGGLLSIYHALNAVAAKSRSIDVDSGGLNLAFVVAAVGIFLGACRVLRIKKIPKRRQWIFFVTWIVLMLTFDIGFEGEIIDKYMTSHGYRHCLSRDRHVGSGKGSIWFTDYVSVDTPCSS